jgi:hypothetical protein
MHVAGKFEGQTNFRAVQAVARRERKKYSSWLVPWRYAVPESAVFATGSAALIAAVSTGRHRAGNWLAKDCRGECSLARGVLHMHTRNGSSMWTLHAYEDPNLAPVPGPPFACMAGAPSSPRALFELRAACINIVPRPVTPVQQGFRAPQLARRAYRCVDVAQEEDAEDH